MFWNVPEENSSDDVEETLYHELKSRELSDLEPVICK